MAATLSVTLEDETLAALDRLAVEARSPRESLVARAIEDLLAYDDWAVSRIVAGVAEADAGAFASDDDIQRVRTKYARAS